MIVMPTRPKSATEALDECGSDTGTKGRWSRQGVAWTVDVSARGFSNAVTSLTGTEVRFARL